MENSGLIPLKTLNRLRLGREVAAEVNPTSPGHKAWVLVWPQVDAEHGYFNKLSDYGESLVFSTSDQNPIKGFIIIFIQIEQARLQEFIDNQWEMPYSTASAYEEDFAADEAELEVKLSKWLSDFSLLQHPQAAGYRFC